ncbi:Pentatricopeptide repeat-containing protein [Thalictrum thalictroides]|uniref:Pentatricopeptide repeat-containing protein n=1 Tax=Thalictrum thalictroides TaxID=46969 RepID=A0A7J6VUS8_THATH|nr:Pentatricopeptide repeat-containing protein [Thalictrum thalictroides]
MLKSITELEQVSQREFALSLLKRLPKSVKDLKILHVYLLGTGLQQNNFAVGNFVAHCATLGTMDYAYQVFDQMIEANSFVWNMMIRGFLQNNKPNITLELFEKMRIQNVRPDNFTYPFVVRACADLGLLRKGEWIHGQLVKNSLGMDVFVATNLIELYVNCGNVSVAHKVFDEMPVRDIVSWTAILSGYVNHANSNMEMAQKIFEDMPVKDLIAWNTMITGYVKIGDVKVAKKLFDEAPVKDILTYNTLLGGVLSACAQVGALDMGRWVHSYINRNKLGLNVVLGTALVDMYCKCGELESAQHVFECMPSRDVVTWNAMIMGYSMNGRGKKAMKFFYKMRDENVMPNEVTMIGVLCACSHAGLVDEGRKCFDAMQQEFDIVPKLGHYGCMVDLFGRAGHLDEAYAFIQAMPLVPHTGVWGALLNACKIHGNLELAECATKHLIELDQEDGGYLAIMSNIYANAGKWDDVSKVRSLMKKKGISKLPGCSSIEINGEIHEFGVEQKIHPRSDEIYKMLDQISKRLRMEGHVASTTEVFFDVEDEEKEKALVYHSEKLAIAFGLIATDKGATIRVVKNLRVCVDCHSAIKLISRIFDREIVVRDRSRFHHFKDGFCSCGDYW